MEYNISQIGVKFKFIRTKNKLTQEELATKLDVDVTTISAIERNARTPSASTIIKFCNYFNISSDYLLSINSEFTSATHLFDLNLNHEDYIHAENLTTDEKNTIKKFIEQLQSYKN